MGGNTIRAAGTDGFAWSSVNDVLLDMDGTLLDRHFDNYVFEEALPRRYGEVRGLPFEEARHRLLEMYRAVEGQLRWADLDYWSRELGLDVVALSCECAHLVSFLPDAVVFLGQLRGMGKRVTVVTNAHPGGVAIKTAKTGLDRHVDRILCAFDVGYLKLQPEFWPACQQALAFDPARTVYIDDDESCLAEADRYGIRFIYHSARSSSQLPPEPSTRYPSLVTLIELTGT